MATGFSSPTTVISDTPEKSKDIRTVEGYDKHIEDKKHTDVISVLLVDDHMLMREGLRQLFSLEQDIRVIGEAVDGVEALQKIRQMRPDVVLMDIHMPGVDGITVTQQVVQEFPEIAVIILSMQQQNQQVLQAVKSGARGYLLKTASVHEVAEAIRTVRAGSVFVAPEMTDMIVKEYRRLSEGAPGQQNIETLQAKEVEIVRYVAMGMSNKEISDKLAYSEKTVKNYLSTIFQKLHLRDRTQVAIFALRHGLLPDEDV
ncbi:MAG: response regulator transcription factor [Ktedonobacteraceae bacterium]|nr:response regulator transcription factor [Ktedonobacteraceae bacterium]MBV9617201.1 response regulator transcription factor [Ktedonobacteraceae bacterium]